MARILVAEDDKNLGFMLMDNLEAAGHKVFLAENGEDALIDINQNTIDLCVVDVMMPKMDGFDLAKQIRKKDNNIPIIFLTAKSFEEDRLRGFEIGGDDYITKPFSIKELMYRISVFLRRSSGEAGSRSKDIKLGFSSFDPENLCYYYGDAVCTLTEMEAQLLEMLIHKQNQLVRREEILERIWGENDYFKGRSLDVFIARLRKYLKPDKSLEIKNYHGVGFSLLVKKN